MSSSYAANTNFDGINDQSGGSYQNSSETNFGRKNIHDDSMRSEQSSGGGGDGGIFPKDCFKINGKKLPLTIIYCISFWNFGICVAIFGPTLLDLACQTSSTLSAMSLLYFVQNFTSLLGCFISGVIAKKKMLKINDILLLGTLLMPFCVALMPLASNILVLGIVMSILGFNMGCIDNIANLAILKLHSNNVSPFIQTMHFFYGLGAFLTPLVVKSFLNSNFDFTVTSSSLNCYNIQDVQEFIKKKPYLPSLHKSSIFSFFHNKSGDQVDAVTEANNFLPDSLATRTKFTSQTKYAFWILALIQLPAPIILILLKLKSKYYHEDNIAVPTNEIDEPKNSKHNLNDSNVSDSSTANAGFEFSFRYIKSLVKNLPMLQLTLLMALLVFLFEGLQASHGGYIFSYIVEKYDIKQANIFEKLKNHSKDNKLIVNRHHSNKNNDDAFITAVFWAFFSIGRLISIFAATKFSASFMLLVDIVGCLVATFIMLLSTFFNGIWILYLATSLLGLFISNTTPTSYSLTEIHIGATPTLTSFIIICAATGEMVLPLISGFLFEATGPSSLVIIELIVAILAAITFARFVYYAREHSKSFDSRDSLIWINERLQNDNIQSKNENSELVGKSSNLYYSRMEDDNDY